jgi:DNA-binding HxlR family transcriptional regulator
MIKDIEHFTSKHLDFMDLNILSAINSGVVTLGNICDKVGRPKKRQWLHHRLGLLEQKGLLKQVAQKRGDTRRLKRSLTREGKKMFESLNNL